MPSGIGSMSREIVIGTAHRYNWIQIGAGVNHPEAGKVLDASKSLAEDTGVEDAFLHIYPYNGYGDANIVRTLIQREKIDGILHFTDPRYWTWLYQLEHEIRETIPIMYYSVWDNLPYPMYNKPYYKSCDTIFAISKQTHNIHKQVLGEDVKKVKLQYIPHGVNYKFFKPITLDMPEAVRFAEFKKYLFGDSVPTFAVLYNNRNVRRKSTSDVIIAFRDFVMTLPEAERAGVKLVLHTNKVDDFGTDLPETVRIVTPEISNNIVWSEQKLGIPDMNCLYNACDVTINMASAEGFGIATLESVAAGKMVIFNVTGGLQDQALFTDENGDVLHEDVHYTKEWGSNADGKYQNHGEWVVPIWPNNRSMIGSPQTPYIYDDRCSTVDATKALLEVYNLPKDERTRRGNLGREKLEEHGFTAEKMSNSFIEGIDDTFATWTPRKRFELIKA